ncbi:DUF396-domain-containing protein [Gigaspora margarita]|uniref:DUF396-domain-containing protein n=1 Tax=Gigaspora margarita TaxID=4874 RepID=A0A8H3XA33_GIGMA|nr:DUF396-domain-containing protein [Gigaspora margarita]
MSLLHLLSYGAALLAFLFVVLSLACGLYYLAEFVEEYTVLTRKIIKNVTGVVVAIHILLWMFDDFPFWRIIFSVMCHGVYTLNLKTFPFISLTSIQFIASCVLVLIDHFLCANDNALPSYDPNIHNTDFALIRNKGGGILKNLLNFVLQKKDELIPMASDVSSSALHSRKSL